jgi:DNA-3-methyladenine glycosylase I
MSAHFVGPDGHPRCHWCGGAPEFLGYHDQEWGFPVADDQRLFEKICLEGFQSGLSWRTILNKRDAFRAAFAGFDVHKVARFTAIHNASRAIEMVEQEGSLAAYFWRHEPDAGELGVPQTASTSATSVAVSKDLKKRGWKFVGPTTVFAFMQAMGLINDHSEGCVTRAKVDLARKRFKRPG